MRRFKLAGMVLALALGWFGAWAEAANFIEKMMMPGQLSAAHAKFEEDCANCHKTLNKEAQSGLCADCHKPIRQDIELGRGFHGKNLVVRKSECFSCHVEHKGRERNITALQPLLFKHDQTEFALKGRHTTADCAGCHAAGKKFREAPKACFDCHKKDDPHRARLGNDCGSCHASTGWTVDLARYDHGKTKFPLKGKHADQPCISCHVGEVYKDLPTGCNDCHAIQDVHLRRFGAACGDCHSNDSWKDAKFDHGKQTKFALLGAHDKAKCSDCHGGDIKAKLSTACVDCHRAQDVHQAKLGKDCGDCHGAVAWNTGVKFDHDLTNYPLVGLHAVAACEACHETRLYKDTKTACIACHAGEDAHAGRFASACGSCHSPVGWKKITFDHGRDTKFALSGAHARVGCYDCHTKKNVADASLPTACISCHRGDDVHHGKFGTDCARCHTAATFRTAIIRK